MFNSQEDLVVAFYRAVDTDNLDDLERILSPSWKETPPAYPEQPDGAEGYRPVAKAFKEAFPDGIFKIEDIFSSVDKVVVRTTFAGTHAGAFLGIAETGKQITFRTIDIHQVSNNQIMQSWHIEDFYGLLQQIAPGRLP